MKTVIKYILLYLLLCSVWAVISFQSINQGWLHHPIIENTSKVAFIKAVDASIESEFLGNFAMAILDSGQVISEIFHSVGEEVNRNTIFQVASLSKFVSAIGIMKLHESGKIDLDAPVGQYLTRWQLPPSNYDHEKVTIRRLLSHTAGLTDGLGYSGWLTKDSVQTLESSLTKAMDADPGRNGVVQVGLEPGSQWEYSGGGFTLLQLVVEEVSGQSFDQYMKQNLFQPLQMNSSFYEMDSLSPRLCEFYYADGSKAPYFYYTSLAATSLHTNLEDLIKFTRLFIKDNNQFPVNKVLSQESLDLMLQPHGKVLGADIYGLGAMLYTESEGDNFVIGHDGKSTPPINTALRINPNSGEAIIVMETGNPDLATRLASDWVFLKTGKVDTLLFAMLQPKAYSYFLIGCILIGLFLAVKRIRHVRSLRRLRKEIF